MRNFLLITTVIVVTLVLVLSFRYLFYKNVVEINTNSGKTVYVKVMISNTSELRQKGLSGYPKLDVNQGMLFIHTQNSTDPYWMIDMNFPLDIIFLNSERRIVYIKENAQPCPNKDNCPLIVSPFEYRYVLEVNGGFSHKYEIRAGDNLITNPFTFAP